MSTDVQLILVLGSVHCVGLGFAAALLWHFMRTDPLEFRPDRDEDGGGGGGNLPIKPPTPDRPRGGGIPLPDAVPARVRIRGGERLADLLPAPARRPAHAPSRTPHRVPAQR